VANAVAARPVAVMAADAVAAAAAVAAMAEVAADEMIAHRAGSGIGKS